MVRTVAGRLLKAGRIGLLPAVFNPPTIAHMALAEEAQRHFKLDQVIYVLPEALPHKRIERPGTEVRLGWLATLAAIEPSRAATACRAGLVIEIVRAFQKALGNRCELFVIAGRDAAERYASWDYGDDEPFAEQLQRYRLLVASRNGGYRIPREHAGRILTFDIDDQSGAASSTAVREAIRAGNPWRHLVPKEIHSDVQAAYGGSIQ